MNHIYRIVLNRRLGIWQVVSELARGGGKTGSDHRQARRRGAGLAATAASRLTARHGPRMLAATLLAACATSPAMAQTIVGSGDIFPGSPANWNNAPTMFVGFTATGSLLFSDGASLINDIGEIANMQGSNGRVTVRDGSRWILKEKLALGDAGGTGTLNILNNGRVLVGGAGVVWLASAALGTGTINIGGLAGSAPSASGTLAASEILFGAGTGTLNFNTTNTHDFAVSLKSSGSGTSQLNLFAGTTRLSADSSGFDGNVRVSGGNLTILNQLGAAEGRIDNAGVSGTTATVTVSGNRAVWANSGNVYV
ncbi:MAG: ESPR-type extended signal peptide-containing protein, partial [Pseudomonas sp.]